jgi:hypothetical protein
MIIQFDRIARSYLLAELVRGSVATLRYMFKQKATLNYPYEKSPQSPGFAASTHCVVLQTAKSDVSRASCVRRFVHHNASSLRRSRAPTGHGGPRVMTLT